MGAAPAAAPVWEDGRWAGLPALEGDSAAAVCVVGLGGSGLSCVHELLSLGVDVIGIDAVAVAAGAAGRNGGFLLAGCYDFHHDAIRRHGRERAVAIYRLTLAEIERIAAVTPAAVRRVGSLRIATSPDEERDCAEQLAAMRADGLAVEPYEGPEGRGLLVPGDAAFDPMLRCRTLARDAVDRGARLYERTPAVRIEPGRVITSAGNIECAAVVIAVDGGLTALLPAVRARVRTARLQMLATAPATDVKLPRPVYARYGLDYWQQLPDSRIALGGCRDAGGDTELTDSTQPTVTVQAALEKLLRDVVGTRAAITHRWAASVGYTADGLPVLEEVAPRVWATGAYSGTGNVIGALCGRAAARAAATGDTSLVSVLASGLSAARCRRPPSRGDRAPSRCDQAPSRCD